MIADPWDYDAMIADIAAHRRFAFARYCDGEFNAIFQRKGANCDGHEYYPDMGALLDQCLKPDPARGYHIGVLPSISEPGRWWASERAAAYLADRADMQCCESGILQRASESGRLDRLFASLVGRRVILIANAGMAALAPWINIARHIVVPDANCWDARTEIEPAIAYACRDPGIALFACSMPAKIWIRRAWDAGGAATLIDIGSVLDPYIGRNSRSYMREGKAILAKPLYREA